MIYEFQRKYRFLSNFWPVAVLLDGVTYPSVEHAYQAAKTYDIHYREKIRSATRPGLAKKMGREAPLRTDWTDEMRLRTMEELLEQKFLNPTLSRQLLATESEELIEGNQWGDRFWGVCRGSGENHLGKLIMKIRDRKRKEERNS